METTGRTLSQSKGLITNCPNTIVTHKIIEVPFLTQITKEVPRKGPLSLEQDQSLTAAVVNYVSQQIIHLTDLPESTL